MDSLFFLLINFVKTLLKTLYLSLTSPKFYRDVLVSYNGYGLKYIVNLAMISSCILSIIFLSYINSITQFFNGSDKSSNIGKNIEYIINQFPAMEYDGQNIKIQENKPYIIYNSSGANIITIDPEGVMNQKEKNITPIIWNKNNITIKLKNTDSQNHQNINLYYNDIFGSESAILTSENLKESLVSFFESFSFFGLCSFMLIITILSVVNSIFAQIYIIAFIYFFMLIKSMKPSLKSCFRLSMFAGGITALLKSIASITFYPEIIMYLQLWANFLMILSIVAPSSKLTFSSITKKI